MTDEVDGSPLLLQLLRAVQVIEERLAPMLTALEVTPEQWRVLTVLADGDGRTMSDLARQAVLPPATATRIVDRLVSRAMVYRRIDPVDRRRIVVFLSPHGSDQIAPARQRQIDLERDLAAEIGSRRFLSLSDGLTHLTR